MLRLMLILLIWLPGPVAAGSEDVHAQALKSERFPSAFVCRECHPRQFKEWSVSMHSYAQLSPAFGAFSNEVIRRSAGTNSAFCTRCHTPLGTALGEPARLPNSERSPLSLEGISCVVCHRINEAYGKVNAEVHLLQGDRLQPVRGPFPGDEVARVIQEKGTYGVSTNPERPGVAIHRAGEFFAPIQNSAFCGSCHDVTTPAGARFEEAFSEWKNSPAAREGTTCQDCHMSYQAGRPGRFRTGPAAFVNGKPTRPRQLANHVFAGPDFSLIHPGIFPHHEPITPQMRKQWELFDYQAGWGQPEKDASLEEQGFEFPMEWSDPDDREMAAELIQGQLALLEEAKRQRVSLLKSGIEIAEVVLPRHSRKGKGLTLKVRVRSTFNGHNYPTGFTAERQLWLHVQLKGPAGGVVFESGHLDPNGDLLNTHSESVASGKAGRDRQLWNAQSSFVFRAFKGTEREILIPPALDADPLPFVRPAPRPSILFARPPELRVEKRNIPPLETKTVRYRVPGKQLRQPGQYALRVRLLYRNLPPHLLSRLGAPRSMIDHVNREIVELHVEEKQFTVQ